MHAFGRSDRTVACGIANVLSVCCASSRLEFVVLCLALLDFACVHEMLAMHTQMGVSVVCSVAKLLYLTLGEDERSSLRRRLCIRIFRKMRFDQECDAVLVIHLHVHSCLQVVFWCLLGTF